ncbi:hypothetical protein N0V88_005686 [Collariella sp. IMI 366227]|nr:hypothetical protein N0V88_005686 [Collariella sp. IMI 366227]
MASSPDDSVPKNEGEGAQFHLIQENEINGLDTSLSLLVDGKPTASMNPAAHGWSRRPLADTRLHGGLWTWGRNKRWEYWGVMTPRHIIGITISSLDYAGVNQLYVVERETLKPWSSEVVDPLARRVRLPDTYAQSDASFTSFDVNITIKESRTATHRITHITASGKQSGIEVDVELKRGIDADALHVVVPWNERQFQYTIKEPAIPAQGTIKIKGETHAFGGDVDSASFGVLDHGRGRWPYSMVWNWAAGSGYVDGKRVGLQLGAKWTDGTGSTENAVIVNGHLTKISEELTLGA